MTHFELLTLLIFKTKKRRILAKKIGYSYSQIYRWREKKTDLILSIRALKKLYALALEVGIEVDKNDLF